MTTTDKISIALRAGMLAGRILDLARPVGKLHCLLVIGDTKKQLAELEKVIQELPKDD